MAKVETSETKDNLYIYRILSSWSYGYRDFPLTAHGRLSLMSIAGWRSYNRPYHEDRSRAVTRKSDELIQEKATAFFFFQITIAAATTYYSCYLLIMYAVAGWG